jgi:hypothetical protein
LITLFAAVVIVEVLLAGSGAFGAMPGKNVPVWHDTLDDKFGVHAAIGGFLTGGSLLLLTTVLIVDRAALAATIFFSGTGLRSIGVSSDGSAAGLDMGSANSARWAMIAFSTAWPRLCHRWKRSATRGSSVQ